MKYNDEEDKCYGIAGMAIGISIWNGEDLLYQIDIDDDEHGYISFTPDYYFSGNPAVSPVESWHATLKHYQMTVGISSPTCSAAICRQASRRNTPTPRKRFSAPWQMRANAPANWMTMR